MHTMHTDFLIVHPGNEADGTDENAYTPAETCDDREARMGRDDGGRPVRRAMKVRKAYRLRKQAVKSHSWFVEECLKTRTEKSLIARKREQWKMEEQAI